MLPESENWSDPHNLAATVMGDPNVAAEVGIIADHNYVANNAVGDQTVPAAMPSYGKALWETEVALLSGSDSSIANGVYYAQRIYLYMTQAQANAYHYWWLVAIQAIRGCWIPVPDRPNACSPLANTAGLSDPTTTALMPPHPNRRF